MTNRKKMKLEKRIESPLANLRKASGYKTRYDLAQAMGVKVTTIVKWESGTLFPSKSDISALSKYFGVLPVEVLDAVKRYRRES